jgi:hypothetical protein
MRWWLLAGEGQTPARVEAGYAASANASTGRRPLFSCPWPDSPTVFECCTRPGHRSDGRSPAVLSEHDQRRLFTNHDDRVPYASIGNALLATVAGLVPLERLSLDVDRRSSVAANALIANSITLLSTRASASAS